MRCMGDELLLALLQPHKRCYEALESHSYTSRNRIHSSGSCGGGRVFSVKRDEHFGAQRRQRLIEI